MGKLVNLVEETLNEGKNTLRSELMKIVKKYDGDKLAEEIKKWLHSKGIAQNSSVDVETERAVYDATQYVWDKWGKIKGNENKYHAFFGTVEDYGYKPD